MGVASWSLEGGDLRQAYLSIHAFLGYIIIMSQARNTYMWQSQVENENYSTLSGPIQLSLECFIEITPDLMCPFMND